MNIVAVTLFSVNVEAKMAVTTRAIVRSFVVTLQAGVCLRHRFCRLGLCVGRRHSKRHCHQPTDDDCYNGFHKTPFLIFSTGNGELVLSISCETLPVFWEDEANGPTSKCAQRVFGRSGENCFLGKVAATYYPRFMKSIQLVRLLPLTAVVIFFSSCGELPPGLQQPVAAALPTPAASGWWNDEGGSGSPRIIVHLTEQKADFYRGKKLVGQSTVSTGKPGFSTPRGYYQVLSKNRDHVSSIFGDYVDNGGKVVKSNVDSRKDRRPPGTHFDGARMPYAMFFRGGYAMHEGYVPPYAASHGCIRLPKGMAEHFYNAAHEGTPVIVRE